MAEADGVRSLRLWDLAAGRELAVFALDCDVYDLAFAPDGRTLYAGCSDHLIRRWDMTRLQSLPSLEGHENEVYAMALSPDGRWLASGSTGRKIRLWDVATGRQIAILIGHADHVDALAFSPDGQTLASGSPDGSVRLWSVATGLELLSLELPSLAPEIRCLAFSRNGKTLAAGVVPTDGEAEILVWSARVKSTATNGAESEDARRE